ncbi:hypothetical protein [Flavobacterium subsaxonicum]|uniref:Uncharacterized protein n=1 Tax=Flavobacterium subsaxonicum WB 4.1-42 = DSM 21790 TaxID=1121898 RepID=A0A0A2MLM3_9FLAO|nr:hypothetical protein [Flavobacterium subsaxonicum]KGO93189.1 hypothetical protein Q766_07725 [Flavobacterium subsaxonicum WB 4.1-42 = DSM 21790]
MKEIIDIIASIENSNVFTNIKPTEIYNEGWMTRLLVYYSKQQNITLKEIEFSKIENWTSEALLSSPFVGVSKAKEGYTHADIALGNFDVNYKQNGEGSGKIVVNPNADTFGIIEAKMGSPLSSFTTNAENYNQASRTVVCIAENTKLDCKTFFYVVLPATKAVKKNRAGISIKDLVASEKIKNEIRQRFEHHNLHNSKKVNEDEILCKVEKCTVGIITYEEWIELFTEEKINKTLNEFYDKCKTWNNIK